MQRGFPGPALIATLELAQADLPTYDLQASVRRLAGSGVNVFVVFAVGYLGGEAYYSSEVAPRHPELGDRDFLREAVAVTEETGTACIAYVNSLFGGPDAWAEHPEWAQRRVDGSPTAMGDARAMCPLSPYGDRIVEAVAEIARSYPVDGLYLDEPSFQSWCSCDACRSGFRAATGHDVPDATGSEDAVWGAFVEWRYTAVAGFIARASRAFHDARPDGLFLCQHAFPMTSTVLPAMRALFEGMLPERVPASAEGWSRTLFYGQRVEAQLASLDALSAELWRRFSDRPVWWPGAATSYLRALARERRVFAFLEYPDFPWSLRPVPADELAYIVVDVRARGGEPWFPLYAPGRADETGWQPLGKVNAAVGRALADAGAPYVEVALAYSPQSADQASADDAERRYLDAFLGVAQLLLERHVPHAVVSLDELDVHQLARVQVLVVPSPLVLSEHAREAIEAYVSSGGAVLFVGDCGARARVAAPAGAGLTALAGFAAGEPVQLGIAYLEWADGGGELFAVRGAVPAVTVHKAEVLASVAHGFQLFEAPPEDVERVPVVLQATHGAGTVTSSTVDIGALVRRFRAPKIGELFGDLLRRAGHTPLVSVDAPPTVAVVPWRGPDGWTVVVLNRTGLEDGGSTIPVGPVAISVPAAAPRARLVGEGDVDPTLRRAGDRWQFVIPTVPVWAVLQVREEEG